MKILITGGCGFIGSNFIHYWLKKYPQDKIINLDKLTYAGHISSLRDIERQRKNYKFVKGDICDPKIVEKNMKGIDVVVHFAAESHVDRSIIGPAIFVKTNVLGTQVLLDSALKNKVKHFHYVGTDEVFGSLKLGTNEKFSEKTSYDPRSPYSASKAAADHFVRAYHETYGLPVTITNSSNNYGPYQDPEKMLPKFITNLIDGIPMTVYGDGKHVRDWVYIKDHCRAIDLVIKKGRIGETYLVGGQTKDVNNLEIARKLLKIFDKDETYIKFVEDRKGHDRRYAIDWRKINTELDWKPKYSFDERLVKTVNWYKENEWWWRPLLSR